MQRKVAISKDLDKNGEIQKVTSPRTSISSRQIF